VRQGDCEDGVKGWQKERLRKAKRRFWVRRPCGTQLVPSPKLPLPTLRLAELVLGLDRRKGIAQGTDGPLFQRERRYRDTPLRFYGHTAECVEWVGLHETARVHQGKPCGQATSRTPRARSINITGLILSLAQYKSPPLLIHPSPSTNTAVCANRSNPRRIRQRCMIQDDLRINTLDSTGGG
jgi:hypothetical protein